MAQAGQGLSGLQQSFPHNYPGGQALRDLLGATLRQGAYDGVRIAGEAPGYLWWHAFYLFAHDPDLATFDPQLLLLNPQWVKWFKKSFPEADKTDAPEAFFIAEMGRQRPPQFPYTFAEDYLALRFYTRYHFHLTHALASEKTYFLAFLFRKASAYGRLRPFADIFGKTSAHILTTYPTLAQVADIPAATLAEMLPEIARNHLPHPQDNATKLHQVAHDSYPLAPAFVPPVHTILEMTLAHIRFLESQSTQLAASIAALAPQYPGVALLQSIPGLGPGLSAALVAKIGDVARFMAGQKYDHRKKRWRKKNGAAGAAALAKLRGLWGPKSASGQFQGEDRRLAQGGNRYARYAYIQAAFCLQKHNAEYRTYYERKYQESHKHQHKRALVLTARKAVNLTFGLLHRQEKYRPPEERHG